MLAFGVVIRGETEHFRLVADAASDGLLRVALDTGVPVLNGVLAVHDAAQAEARSGGALGNRGAEVALAAIEMARLARPGARLMARATESARRRARELAFRVAYQADVTSATRAPRPGARCREAERLTDDQAQLVDRRGARARDARRGSGSRAARRRAEHWSLARLAATDRAVLRLAAAELLSRPGTPARVVLDEAIEIAKRLRFGESRAGS